MDDEEVRKLTDMVLDEMHADRVSGLLEANLAERTTWDEPPELHIICKDNCEDSEPGWHLHHTPAPPGWWNADRPPVMLMKLALAMGRYPEMFRYDEIPSLESFAGVAFFCETWSVAVPASGEAAERLRRASVEHELHKQPERVEARCMWACDINGRLYAAIQQRGKEVSSEEISDLDHDGTVIQAVSELVMNMRVVLTPDTV